MSKKHLYVSNELLSICFPENAKMTLLGEVLHEHYHLLETNDDVSATGTWDIEVACSLDKIHQHCSGIQVFRIASNNESVSRVGELAEYGWPDLLNDENLIGVTIDTMPNDPIRHTRTENTT